MIATLPEIVESDGVFVDGDWVESKDQDPNGDVRLIQLADIGVGKFLDKSARFMTTEKAHKLKCTFLEPGDILIARMPDPIGRACIFAGSDQPCVTVVDVCILRVNQRRVDRDWLVHFINSSGFQRQINRWVTGTTRQRISRGNLARCEIPLPPLKEQERIAAILDKADAIRRKRQQAIELTDQLLRSVFLDMFGDPMTNPKGTELAPMTEVFNTTTGKLDSNAAVEGGIYPFFTCAKEVSAINTYAFDEEALLLAGNNAQGIYDVKHYQGKFNAYQRTYVLTLTDDRASYPFYKYALEYQLENLRRYSKGTNTKYITLEIMSRTMLPVPSIGDQNNFAEIFKTVQLARNKLDNSSTQLDTLSASITKNVFRTEDYAAGGEAVA